MLTEFDVESATWATRVVDNTPPLRRACHGAGVVGKHVYVVGGRYWDVAEDDYIFLNDIHILDTRPASTYSSDWRRYLSNESLSDVTLQVEGLRIPAHRVVLAARCAYFETMFSSGMRESTQQARYLVITPRRAGEQATATVHSRVLAYVASVAHGKL